MVPQRYLIATLFIAAMLAIVMVVRVPKQDGPSTPAEVTSMAVAGFEQIADLRLEDGWSPRFLGAQDPDQALPWPFEGGFGLPWEPASPYLGDQGVALNGPNGRSEVALWRGLEWRRTRFDAPLASARLRGNRLLVTLRLSPTRFETRLIEVPEGRVIWSTPSGPWSRFSWDGKAVLLGLLEAEPKEKAPRLILTSLPLDGEPGEATLAPWDEPGLPPPPRGWPTTPERLSDEARDLPGDRLPVPWSPGGRVAFTRRDRLWTATAGRWILWRLRDGAWHREAEGEGALLPQPPRGVGLVRLEKDEVAGRLQGPVGAAEFQAVSETAEPWPGPDPAWAWTEEGALTAWDLRWGRLPEDLTPERQRVAVQQAFRGDWNAAKGLRQSVKGWLPRGPEVALRELQGVAWCWVGDRVILARLTETARIRRLKKLLPN